MADKISLRGHLAAMHPVDGPSRFLPADPLRDFHSGNDFGQNVVNGLFGCISLICNEMKQKKGNCRDQPYWTFCIQSHYDTHP